MALSATNDVVDETVVHVSEVGGFEVVVEDAGIDRCAAGFTGEGEVVCWALFGNEVAFFGEGKLFGNAERREDGVGYVEGVDGEEGNKPSSGDFGGHEICDGSGVGT